MIGAGSSGIAAVKALHERGIPVECFEKSDRVGGNWVFANKNGMSSAYRSLHANTSRERMEYSDFPMPKSYPDFPHHTQIAHYFSDYVSQRLDPRLPRHLTGAGGGGVVRGGFVGGRGGAAGKRWRYSERVTVLVPMVNGLRLCCGGRGGDPWPALRSAA